MPIINLVADVPVPIIDRAPLLAAEIPSTNWHARVCRLAVDDPTTLGAAVVLVGNQQPNGASSGVSTSNYDIKLSISNPTDVLGNWADNVELDLSQCYVMSHGGNVRLIFNPEVSGGE